MNVHTEVARVGQEKSSGIGMRRLGEDSPEHALMSAGLKHEKSAIVIEMGLEKIHLLAHGPAVDFGKLLVIIRVGPPSV